MTCHIICMTETLRPEVMDTMISGFSLLRWDRVGRRSGVVFYYRSYFRASLRICSEAGCSGRPEFLIAEVFRYVSSLLLGIVYRPPNTGYLQEFQNKFLDLQTNYKHSIIFVDFNADMLTDTYDSMQLKNFTNSANLYCVPY